MKRTTPYWLITFFLFVVAGCAPTVLKRNVYMPNSVGLKNMPAHLGIIKIHLKNGGLYVLNRWSFDEKNKKINGQGDFYDYKRKLVSGRSVKLDSEAFEIPYSDVSLIETNKLDGFGRSLLGISVEGVPSAVYAIYCIANPKACFGSCPTFYMLKDGKWQLVSEGFSSSISSAFEKKDIDMLYGADQTSGTFTLKLTNEALETHVIRYVDLLAFPQVSGEMVFATPEGEFYRTSAVHPPESCRAAEGDILPFVSSFDRKERFSYTDEHNLTEKEEIVLTFKNTQRQNGLLIGSKQTLLTTFLFYQLMAFTGNHYGDLVAKVENGDERLTKQIQRMWDKLGGIELFLQSGSRKWQKIGEIDEMGPIASDIHLVKLPPVKQDTITMKLRMTKGLWRIDYLALADIAGEETPVRVEPESVWCNDTLRNDVLSLLKDKQEPLVTLPGDRYEIRYRLPGDCNYQLFLETKGYYLEWMRNDWLKEENLKSAALALYFPGLFMRKTAPAFKAVEPQMENIFWNSRYVRQ